MGALSRFEQLMEQLMEGSFTRLLRSQLQPVEIAKRLERAMEDSRAVSAGGRMIVANRYEVLLNPHDFALFEPYKAGLERELAQYITEAAKEERFILASHPLITVTSSTSAMRRRPLVRASKADTVGLAPGQVTPKGSDDAGALEGHTTRLNLSRRPTTSVSSKAFLRATGQIGSQTSPIGRLPFNLGRGLDNDFVLEDSRVSRHHARIEELNRRLLLVDLRSTNGTFVNGEIISKCLLSDGDVISLGGLEFQLSMEDKP